MSDLKMKDLKGFEELKEQDWAAVDTLKLIQEEEQLKPEEDKGKAKVGIPLVIKEVVVAKPMDEAARSSKVFSMAQWQTQMEDQVREVAAAYHTKVTLKREALK